MSPRILLLSSLGLLAASAHAVQPAETVVSGAMPETLPVNNPAHQRWIAQNHEPWLAFQDEQGAGWEARFDERRRIPLRMWGRGIDLGPLGSEQDVIDALATFQAEHADLLGTTFAEGTWSATYDASRDAWYADFHQTHKDAPIRLGGVTYRILQGKLVMVGSTAHLPTEAQGTFRKTHEQAVAIARQWNLTGMGEAEVERVHYAWMPLEDGKRPYMRPAAVVRFTQPEGVPAQWTFWVDADSGQVLGYDNSVRFLEGTLSAEARHRDGGTRTDPLPFVWAANNLDGGYSDTDGHLDIEGNTAEISLLGRYAELTDLLGDATPVIDGLPTTLTADDFQGRTSALTTWQAIHRVRDVMSAFHPTLSWLEVDRSEPVQITVNVNDSCNAWFDGTLNFLRSDDTCRNTGTMADVAYHEWGHGFHAYSILSGTFDGSMGEGYADAISFLVTRDHRLGPGFFKSTDAPLRDMDNDARYPDDYRTNQTFIHTNGLIFGGAIWDTWLILKEQIGDDEAHAVLGQALTDMIKGGPSIPNAWEELLFALDDDADLSNGVPYECAFMEGFGLHGLGPLGGGAIELDHAVQAFSDAGQDSVMQFSLLNGASQCVDIKPATAQLMYRVDGGEWKSLEADVTDVDLQAIIPATDLPDGGVLEYYLQGKTTQDGLFQDPPGGEITPHTTWVGPVLEVVCDDFEASNGDYTHALLAGGNEEGADDWRWGTPIGVGGDPDGAASGLGAWGNDLGGGRYDGKYQPNKHNQLSSRRYDLGHYQDAFLQFNRWLTVEDGLYDGAMIFADDVKIWGNFSSVTDGSRHHIDTSWAPHAVPLQGEGDDGKVKLSWEIRSDAGLEFGGWNIDDVCIYAPATPDNRLSITNIAGVRGEEGVKLSWTQPLHGPVSEVVIVRRGGRFPESHSDGQVVATLTDIEPGATGSFVDPTPWGGQHYAIYASDGTDWSERTVEGMNATMVQEAGSLALACGCQTGGPGPTGLWLGLGAFAWARRRKQQA